MNNIDVKNNSIKFIRNLTIVNESINYIPSVTEFYSGFPSEVLFSISAAVILCIIVKIIFFTKLPILLQNTPSQYIARTLILCAIYPVVASAAFVSIAVPKSMLICDTICHLGFTFCAYQFFCLCLEYVKGETNFIKAAEGESVFNMRTPPCCCCILCIRPKLITKQHFLFLRFMILQMSIFQGILFIILNIVFLENMDFFNSLFIYFVPFIIISIITGVWGLQMTVRMISPLYPECRIMGKYVVLQLVLILCKFQPAVCQAIIPLIDTGVQYPITPKVLGNTIAQLLILVEMIVLSIWAQKLYLSPSNDDS